MKQIKIVKLVVHMETDDGHRFELNVSDRELVFVEFGSRNGTKVTGRTGLGGVTRELDGTSVFHLTASLNTQPAGRWT